MAYRQIAKPVQRQVKLWHFAIFSAVITMIGGPLSYFFYAKFVIFPPFALAMLSVICLFELVIPLKDEEEMGWITRLTATIHCLTCTALWWLVLIAAMCMGCD